MPQQRTPQTIAAHLRLILAPAIDALTLPGDDARRHVRILRACASTLDNIDLVSIAWHLADQRACASEGRPRGGTGVRARNAISDPTGDTANELHRIIDLGMDLQRAIDRIHPDPDWPTIASGWRAMQSTSTEAIAALIDQVRHGEAPAIELADAIDTCADNVRHAHKCAQRADKCRAWLARFEQPADVDPPDPILEAMRCASTMLGVDKDGEPIRCGKWRTTHRDANGSEVRGDLCGDCFQLLCVVCHSNPRRTAGAKDCMRCEIRARRGRAA